VADSAAAKNIIPADYFADVAGRIIRRGVSGTYHITHPRPTSFGELREIFVELFGCDNATLVSKEQFAEQRATSAERACHRAMAVYRPYMTETEPVFDSSATDRALAGTGVQAPVLDAAYFRRLLDYARRVDWGRKRGTAALLAPLTDPVV
jgi:hypothetical protein